MESPFHSFCTLIQSLDQNDDSIVLDRNLKYLASDLNDVLEGDENMLWSALEYFNERALENEDFAVNFAMLFTSQHFDGLREHLQSSDGSSIFRGHILNMLQQNHTNAEKLKLENIARFYNSITLLGEFYNRLHQKSYPVLIIGRSLFELLTKELKSESAKCSNDPNYVFSVQFARLLLTQVTLNGSLAKVHHSNEIEALFYELRKCLIEIPNLASITKAFLLMSLDLYHSGFKSVGASLEKFYSKFLDEHDGIEQQKRKACEKNEKKTEEPNRSYSLRNLRNDFAGLKTNGGQEEHRKINREYLNRPLKASDRLKYFQNSNSELTKRNDERSESPRNQQRPLKESTSESNLSQTNSLNNNQSECNDNQNTSTTSRPALLTISTNCQDTNKVEAVNSPTESQFGIQQIPSKLETFNWFEEVEREEIPEFTPSTNLNNSGGSSKFDTLSVASYNSNPASPQECVSPQSSHTNRSRRNSLNRFGSDAYSRQSNEDLQQNEKRPHRNDTKQNYHSSWRNSGRNSPRNETRNGYNKRNNDYDRRGLVRGGSVDSKVKDFNTHQTRTRHDSFNRRNQENDNFEHFQSYNRKTYSRNKDNFMTNRSLPPRLQQKWQQQRADYNNDCDNPKSFNNRNQTGASNSNAVKQQ